MSSIKEQDCREVLMVDLAYQFLLDQQDPVSYKDLMDQIFLLKGFSKEEIKNNIASLYTDFNVDGRFVCVGRGMWGLRSWYPVERSSDAAVALGMRQDDLEEEELVDEVEEAIPLEKEEAILTDAVLGEDLEEELEEVDGELDEEEY
ncbi:MAG: DNA-directed polymerase subunit delta [Bacillota bacterium]